MRILGGFVGIVWVLGLAACSDDPQYDELSPERIRLLVDARTDSYVLGGDTASDVLIALRLREREGRDVADTSWEITYALRYAEDGKKCAILWLNLKLRIVSTLPEPAGELPPGLSAAWADIVAALTVQEQEQAQLIESHGIALREDLRALDPVDGTCSLLDRQIERLLDRRADRIELESAALRLTHSGSRDLLLAGFAERGGPD